MPNPVDRVNLDFYEGSTFTHDFTIRDVNEVLVPLTGFGAFAEFRDGPDIEDALLHTASVGNAELVVVENDSIVRMIIDGDVIGDFNFVIAFYDLFIISPQNNAYAVARGRARVYQARSDPQP